MKRILLMAALAIGFSAVLAPAAQAGPLQSSITKDRRYPIYHPKPKSKKFARSVFKDPLNGNDKSQFHSTTALDRQGLNPQPLPPGIQQRLDLLQ